MSNVAPLHPNVTSVVEAAQRQGIEIVAQEFPAGTRTADDAAAAVGVDVSQIVKTLVFLVDDQVVLALVSGPNRLDEARLATAMGASHVARADADRVRAATGQPIGGVAPCGHPTELPTLIDRDLLTHTEVWAAAGTPRHVFPIAPADLVRLSGASPADLAVR